MGRKLTAPAICTPGNVPRPFDEFGEEPNPRARSSAYFARGNCIRMVRTLFGSKPGSTPRMEAKLRNIRPAPTSKTTANATFAITERMPQPAEPRPAADLSTAFD